VGASPQNRSVAQRKPRSGDTIRLSPLRGFSF
jgi:hypothetical protein